MTPTPDPSERPEVEPLSARDKYRGLDAWLEAQDRRISTLTAERDALSAEVASRERGRLGLVAARDDAVDQAVKAMARAAVLSAELERLRGIVEAASERHFIEYPSASDETWQTNARCACGASLLCTELVALAALHPVSEEGPQPGRCAAQMPGLLPDCPPLGCTLRAGHAGMHHDQDGADWSPAVSEEGER